MGFDLKKYLQDRQKQVDEALNRFLPSPTGRAAKIHEAMRYSVFAGGKRLRPIVCLAAYEIFKDKLEEALPAACALELIHTYSLIHDDLPCMDNDDFRRGHPTSHKVFGEAMAVLAGDALLTLAFELLTQAPVLKPGVMVQAVREVARAAGTDGLIGGQVEDLAAEGKKISAEDLQSIHLHKTAALLGASARLGAILGEATLQEFKQISRYGEKIGLAFQIVDDILDVESSSEAMGKQTQKDSSRQKATYPSLFGVEKSKQLAAQLQEEAIAALKTFGTRAQVLQELARYITERQN